MAEDSNATLEDYVFLEAKERTYEIEIKALKEFEKEKARLFEKEKQVIIDEYDKKLRQKEAEYKIERSSRINKSRLRKMEARNAIISKILDEAEVQVAKKIEADKNFYKELLKKLIIQSFIKLMEHKVYIRCLERDVSLVQDILPQCVDEFKEFIKKELDLDWTMEAEVDMNQHLELRNISELEHLHQDEALQSKRVHKSEEDRKCFGGIIALNADKSIVCKNTIDVRLDLCFQESLPNIRKILFDAK